MLLLAALALVQIVLRTKRLTANQPDLHGAGCPLASALTGVDVSSRPLFRRILRLSLGRLGFWPVVELLRAGAATLTWDDGDREAKGE